MEEYINGSDLLVNIGENAAGHCTSHTATFNTETKEVSVKPKASEPKSGAKLFKKKRVVGKSAQVKCDGLSAYGEDETGVKALLVAWKNGTPVALSLFHRGNSAKPYASGNFIITSLEESAPAGDDVTYSATFDNDGEVEIDETGYAEAVSQS